MRSQSAKFVSVPVLGARRCREQIWNKGLNERASDPEAIKRAKNVGKKKLFLASPVLGDVPAYRSGYPSSLWPARFSVGRVPGIDDYLMRAHTDMMLGFPALKPSCHVPSYIPS